MKLEILPSMIVQIQIGLLKNTKFIVTLSLQYYDRELKSTRPELIEISDNIQYATWKNVCIGTLSYQSLD